MREWEQINNMPAKYAFPNLPEDMFSAIRDPDSRSEKNLKDAIETLECQDRPDIDRSRNKFMEDMLPEQYRGLIEYSDLVYYLRENVGEPSRWRRNTDLKPLIRDLYSVKIVPKAKERIDHMGADELKKVILETIQNNEGLGIEIIKAIK